HGLISRPTPVRIRPPQLFGLEVLRQHATLVSVEDRVRFPAGPLLRCSISGGRKAVIRRRRKPDSVGSIPTPLTLISFVSRLMARRRPQGDLWQNPRPSIMEQTSGSAGGAPTIRGPQEGRVSACRPLRRWRQLTATT